MYFIRKSSHNKYKDPDFTFWVYAFFFAFRLTSAGPFLRLYEFGVEMGKLLSFPTFPLSNDDVDSFDCACQKQFSFLPAALAGRSRTHF